MTDCFGYLTSPGPRQCVRCGRDRKIKAHRLCGTCYSVVRSVRSASGQMGPVGGFGDPDRVVIYRVLTGEKFRMNCAERRAVVAEFTRQGVSAAEIARRMGIAQRSVCRLRARAA